MQRRNASGMTFVDLLAWGFLISLAASSAHAGSHTWNVNEVYSDASGHIQFIELVEANGTPGELGVPGHMMTSVSAGKNFLISGPPLASPSSNKFYLLGTPGFAALFAALPGAPTPDAIIPSGVLPFFFSTGGDTVTYVPWDSLGFGPVPTDGVTSLNAPMPPTPGVNSPTNYAGQTGSVPEPGSTVMLVSGVALLLGLERKRRRH